MSSVSFLNRESARHAGSEANQVLGAEVHRQPTKQLRKLREISAQKLCAGTVSGKNRHQEAGGLYR
jgi:hypothetical protein